MVEGEGLLEVGRDLRALDGDGGGGAMYHAVLHLLLAVGGLRPAPNHHFHFASFSPFPLGGIVDVVHAAAGGESTLECGCGCGVEKKKRESRYKKK